jgi:hypothetical protein
MVATKVELDIRVGRMVNALYTKLSDFLILIFQRPVTATAVAMADQVMSDFRNNYAHLSYKLPKPQKAYPVPNQSR